MQDFLLVALTGLSLGLAWLFPAKWVSVILGWIFVIGLILLTRTKRPIRNSYLAGIIAIAIGFYWIPYTVQVFGGFHLIPAYAIQLLFVTVSAGQFAIFTYLSLFLRRKFLNFNCTTAIAWLVSELIWIRIFPWEPAHTQLKFTEFVQIADLLGTSLITFLMYWLIEVLTTKQVTLKRKIPVIIIFIISILYGYHVKSTFSNLELREQPIAMIQANITTEEKHSVMLFKRNVDRYVQLTEQTLANSKVDPIFIWPESVILDWIPDETRIVSSAPQIPTFSRPVNLLSGALTYDLEQQNYNSALAVYKNGQVPQPYHKRVLLAFGEYMPGVKWFPWLQDFNPMAKGFTAGSNGTVFEFPVSNGVGEEWKAKLSPLICYEDVLPELSRESVLNGAELIINLTNDAWFGDTHAPLQHNLIASFRAIENKRYLLRSTNSGLTAVINPLGVITDTLPTFSDGTITTNVALLNSKTIYTEYFGDVLRYLCLIFVLFSFLLRKLKLQKN
jgi:apolipoprotein N-acyltransferase